MGALDFARRALSAWTGRSIESGTPGVEGQPKEGPWHILNQGWLPEAWGYSNFWQMDLDPKPGGTTAIVEACISAYAQTIAMCPGDHWVGKDNGGRDRVTTSALSRILRRPNDYQSRSDFILDLASDLYRTGNTYALAIRNDRYEVASFHPFNPLLSRPVVGNGGAIFYELAGNEVLDRDRSMFTSTRAGIIAPARDVLHIKLEPEPSNPLVGIPPGRHAANSILAQRAIGGQLIKTFGTMDRPSGIIETDQQPSAEQMTQFRKKFNEAWASQGPPLLSHGWKWKSVALKAEDMQLAQIARLTQDEIFAVYGVPPAILGLTDKATFSSTEALMQFWLARGLGFAINHIEVGFDHFFGLRGWPNEYVEMDTAALLRVAYKDRIDGLVKGVQGGVYAPNEARNLEELPDAESGDEPRVQQQVVPLSAWDKAPPSTPAPGAPSPAPPADAGGEEDEPKEESAVFDVRAFEEGEADYARANAA